MQWIKYTFRYVCLGPLPSGVDLTILLSIILFIYLFYILFLQCNADVYCSNFNATLGAPFGATAFWAQICVSVLLDSYFIILCYVMLFYFMQWVSYNFYEEYLVPLHMAVGLLFFSLSAQSLCCSQEVEGERPCLQCQMWRCVCYCCMRCILISASIWPWGNPLNCNVVNAAVRVTATALYPP